MPKPNSRRLRRQQKKPKVGQPKVAKKGRLRSHHLPEKVVIEGARRKEVNRVIRKLYSKEPLETKELNFLLRHGRNRLGPGKLEILVDHFGLTPELAKVIVEKINYFSVEKRRYLEEKAKKMEGRIRQAAEIATERLDLEQFNQRIRRLQDLLSRR